jgi:hypothetical protein
MDAELDCSDDSAGGLDISETINVPVVANVPIFVFADSFNNNDGTYVLTISLD